MLAVAAACSVPPPPPAPLPPSPPPPTALAANTASPPDAGAPPVAEPEPPRAPYIDPRRPIPGSTRSTIACNGKRCKAPQEVCALVPNSGHDDWACVTPDLKEKANAWYECDDGTDCPQGKTCCQSFASAARYDVCTTRNLDCSIEVCAPGGARCPAEQTCKDGYCVPSRRPLPTCDKGAKCTEDKPFCALQSGKLACVSKDQAQALAQKRDEGADISLLRCTQNTDCGAGFRCCTGGSMGSQESFCTLNCDIVNTAQYCATTADCPRVPQWNFTCQPIGNGFPPWAKLCRTPP